MADDAAFGAPYIDVDEWRTSPRRHRYLHGGFEDTHTRFSLYFPPLEDYRGRFVQFLEGGAGGHENLLASGAIEVPELADMLSMDWLFALAFDELGSYLVESNQGHFPGEGVGFNDDIQMYRASAQVARYAKDVAAGVYGEAPHHGYVWGQSGGGVRCFACIENVSDVWDGGVPEVATGLATIPIWSAQALATELLLGDNLREGADALAP